MGAHRVRRLEEEIRSEVSRLLLFEAGDPRIRDVTVTRVTLTRDLGLARVYYESSNPDQRTMLQEGLEAATPFIRRNIASRLDLRLAPQIAVYYDETSEEDRKVEKLFSKL